MYSIKVVHKDSGIVNNDFFEGNKVNIHVDTAKHITDYMDDIAEDSIKQDINSNISDNIDSDIDIILGVVIEEREDYIVRNILCYRNATIYLMNDLGNTIDSWSVKG